MARASGWLFSLFMCLVLAVASSVTVVYPQPWPVPAPKQKADCYKSVTETPRKCAAQVLQALLYGDVHITKDCCEALRRVGEETCSICHMCRSIG
ncbi:hypothetical protein CFC21_072078 [Triticum aestivum]|uniref:Prolamin-like domain-containing protein n=2 Tax=Triticum aestivum TaxID=4565 RepID=A0A9R1HIJ7_WHEAT|nr:hypothetical protein CFC21_072078 [Triticum aestivum]